MAWHVKGLIPALPGNPGVCLTLLEAEAAGACTPEESGGVKGRS